MSNHRSNDSFHSSEFLKPNTLINSYSIIKRLATGGMGNIYLAEDTKLNRKVVLKLITNKHSQNDQYKEMLIREAQLSAGLNHSNIVTIYEIIEYKNQPVIVMEYIEGEDLQTLLNTKPFSIEEIVDIIQQVATALSVAHSVGIIHKDIKPANILINNKDQLKVLDFGLASFANELDSDLYSQSSGTLNYMSPEQVNNSDVTYQSDLFSLGVVFYQLLTGNLPFVGDYEASVKYAIANEQPALTSKLNNEVDEYLEQIVSKLLQKNPDDRYQSGEQLLIDLKQWKTLKEATAESKKKLSNNSYLILFFSVSLLALIYFVSPKIFPPDNSLPINLAVLPFENLGAADDEYFADGITDAITNNLSKIDNIRVISRRSALLYKGSDLKMTTIGEELNVKYLLTGTIHWDKKNNNKIRIYTALIDTENDTQKWANHYDSHTEGIFAIQSSISQEIIQAMQLVLSEIDKKDLTKVQAINFEAYDLYLQGNEYFNRSWEKHDIEIAMQLYQQAIALDSNFAAAYAMLSRCYSSMFWEYYDHSSEMCMNAKQTAEKALSLQAKQAEGIQALGYYYYHCEQNFDKALAIFIDGLTVHKNNSDLYNAVAAIMRRQGKLKESRDNFMHSYKLDPRSHLKAFDIALTFGMMRQYDSSEYYANKSVALAPDYSLGHLYCVWLPIIKEGNITEAGNRLIKARQKTDLTSSKYYWWLLRILKIDKQPILSQITPGTDSIAYYLYLAQSYRLNKDNIKERIYADSVLKILEEKIKINPNDARFNSALGLAYAGIRDREKAMFYGQKALELAPTSKEAFDAPFLVMDFAEILLIIGEHEAAAKQLNFLKTIPGFVSQAYLEADPLWQNLFDEETFQELLNDK